MARTNHFNSKIELQRWLKSGVAITILSMSLHSDVVELRTNISSSFELSRAIQYPRVDTSLPEKGHYIITYENKDGEQHNEDVQLNTFNWAYCYEVELDGAKLGCLSDLMEKLSKYEFFWDASLNIHGVKSGNLYVVTPSDPQDLNELIDILKEYSALYALFVKESDNMRENLKTGHPRSKAT
ncbi:hypothetical protein [Enterovibrio calviensis]|uniref:hypothetical protein n=1 Tax=Enterovibrio calviensis TaxID=91359 RepID=UPI0004834AD9|nr:hypothetical protein [Enterovibrio calviensis]